MSKPDEVVTSDLSRFGYREKRLAAELLLAMCEQALPENFTDEDVTVAMNTHSGYVFLTNAEYESCLLRNGKLERWEWCPNCGTEGFKDEVADHGKDDPECQEWLADIGAIQKPVAE